MTARQPGRTAAVFKNKPKLYLVVEHDDTQVHHFTPHLWLHLWVAAEHIQPRTSTLTCCFWIRSALKSLTSYTFLSHMLSPWVTRQPVCLLGSRDFPSPTSSSSSRRADDMKGVQHVRVSLGLGRSVHVHGSLHMWNQSSSIEACMQPPPPPGLVDAGKQGAVVQPGGHGDVAPI